MNKGATKTSGILTLILYFLLLVVSVAAVATVLEITAITDILSSNEMLAKIVGAVSFPFTDFPTLLVMKFMPEIDVDTFNMIGKIIAFVFAGFSAYMIFWGIKEITLAKKDDASFANCKKTCGFMMFIKFMLFVYFVAVVACCFLIEEFKAGLEILEEAFGMANVPVIVGGVLAVYSFIIFLLPTINFSKAAKAVAEGSYTDPNANYDPNAQYNNQNGYYDPNAQQQYAAQPTMQANMPPMPGYQPQYNMQQQPSIQAQFNPEVQAAEMARANQIIPGENGVPANITQKGIEDLERLERLRASGAITEENYAAMRNKIFTSNIA